MEQETTNYELAYLLPSTVPETEVLMYAGKLSALIEEQKGVIKHVQEPRKQKLAYPIKKERNAYFGWTTFRLNPLGIKALEKKLKTESTILRYLIVLEETRLKAPIFRTPIPKSGSVKTPAIPREAQNLDEKLDLEALDKKLEEILGK
ncbi:MAG: 30S ribosomal protein S6 [Candidatus Sungbacteria bacterium]|nr:30S ribosomal protein S6 [bacterium]MDZ4260161.1 30S ribosomal protein S6 [Candidatus Sungbacteria bacterium]